MAQPTVLADTGKIRLELEKLGDVALFRPIGVIDEDVNFSVILALLQQPSSGVKEVKFDLSQVTRMNSCGVREWLLLMERLNPGLSLSFVNVCELFVEQANMIPNIFGKKGTPVVSFEAPYHCVQCNHEATKWLEPKMVKFANGLPIAPEQKCDKCSRPMSFDWLEEEYFAFLKRL